MRLYLIVFVLLFAAAAAGQTAEDVLATAAGKNYTADALSPEIRRVYLEKQAGIAAYRAQLAEEMLADTVLALEAKSRPTTEEKLLSAVTAPIPAPTVAQLRQLYAANRDRLGDRTFDEVRGDLDRYLRAEAEEKAVAAYVDKLKAKYKAEMVTDVNASGAAAATVLFRAGGRAVTVAEFEQRSAPAINDRQFSIYDDVVNDLRSALLNDLVVEEAKSLGVAPEQVIASEITAKLKGKNDDASRFQAVADLARRLFAKYNAQILVKKPEALIQSISTDDDPAIGPTTAQVTIVMFTDYQCPSCAAAYPVLTSVMEEFPGKVRLVVRDYPLTSIHANAFGAALAANAARMQGKYREYTELLYANQKALDAVSLRKYASQTGLNRKRFELDLSSPKAAAEVNADIADGKRYGVTWTPSVYVNGEKMHGSTADVYRTAIEAALRRTPAGK